MMDELSSRPTSAPSALQVWAQAGVILCLMIAGSVLIAQALPWLVDRTGGDSAAVLLAARPVFAGMVVVVLVGVVAILAAAVAHWTGWKAAAFGFGAALAVLPLRTGSLVATLSGEQSPALFPLETLLCTIISVAALSLIARAGRTHESATMKGNTLQRIALLVGILLGAACGLAVAWILAVRPDPGQTFAAALLGSLVVTVVVRIVAPDGPLLPIVIGIMLAAMAAQSWAWWQVESPRMETLQTLHRTGSLPPWLLIRPLDWFAGAPVGAVLGCLWSDSFRTERESDEPAERIRS